MQPGGQSLEPWRPRKMLLGGNSDEHTHRARRFLLPDRLHLRRLPNRATAEPQDQEAEQNRAVLSDGTGYHHGWDSHCQDSYCVAG